MKMFLLFNLLETRKNHKPLIETLNKEDISKYRRNSYHSKFSFSCDKGILYKEADFLGNFNNKSVYCNVRNIYNYDMPVIQQISTLLKMDEIDFEINVMTDITNQNLCINNEILSKINPLEENAMKEDLALNKSKVKLQFKLKPNNKITMLKNNKNILLGTFSKVQFSPNGEVNFIYENGDEYGLGVLL